MHKLTIEKKESNRITYIKKKENNTQKNCYDVSCFLFVYDTTGARDSAFVNKNEYTVQVS